MSNEREYVEIVETPVDAPKPESEEQVAAEAPATEEVAAVEEKPSEEETPQETEHKRKTGSQRARERADRAEREAAELRAELAALRAPQPTAANEPRLDEFETVEDYARALREYAAKEAAEKTEARIRAEAEAREFQQRQTSWVEADRRFAEKQHDFDDVMEDLRDVLTEVAPRNPRTFAAIDSAVSESTIAPQLKYYFGKNPAELQRINAMTPMDAIKAIGRLEDKISNEKPPDKKTTKAPDPIKPLTGTGSGSVKASRYDTYLEVR